MQKRAIYVFAIFAVLLMLGARTFVGVFAAPSLVNTMQLSSSALVKISKLTRGANPNYAAAYAVAHTDLQKHYPNATGADADVIHWLDIAQQVNSGAKSFQAIAICAVNAVASQYELGKTISLFGPEEQAASNAIAKDFFTLLINNNGTVQTFNQIIQDDALDGVVHTLGLSPAAWAGALPDAVVASFTGFKTDTYYDTLTSAQQQEAVLLHTVAGSIIIDESLGVKFGLSQATIDTIVTAHTLLLLGLLPPISPIIAGLANNVSTIDKEYGAMVTALNALAKNVTSASLLSTAETDIEKLLGMNQGVNLTNNDFEVGADVNLDLPSGSSPRFSLDLSSKNGTLMLTDTIPIAQNPIPEDVTFLDASGILQLQNLQNYNGTIYSFASSDTIDLVGIGLATSATLGAGNVLTVTESNGNTITLNFDPNQVFSGKTFSISSDNNGGTNITPPARIVEYPVPTSNSGPIGITTGPDGNLWFTEASGNQIGKITPAGAITEYPIPLLGQPEPIGIIAGPDGNLWFTMFDASHIGKITPSGAITEYTLVYSNNNPGGITAGPDGNLWFTEGNGNSHIGKITPSGVITLFPLSNSNSNPENITTGPDGNLWFTEENGNQIGRITPSGAITEYPVSASFSYPYAITTGPDGNLWFTETGSNQIGKITLSGAITEYPIPTSNSIPDGITAGPDGNLWFTETGSNKIGKVILNS